MRCHVRGGEAAVGGRLARRRRRGGGAQQLPTQRVQLSPSKAVDERAGGRQGGLGGKLQAVEEGVVQAKERRRVVDGSGKVEMSIRREEGIGKKGVNANGHAVTEHTQTRRGKRIMTKGPQSNAKRWKTQVT